MNNVASTGKIRKCTAKAETLPQVPILPQVKIVKTLSAEKVTNVIPKKKKKGSNTKNLIYQQ